MPIFFNVEKVREFLIKYGYVYTLRKKRFRVGDDMAVYGSRFKQTKIGKVFIEMVWTPIGKITKVEELLSYVRESGLDSQFSPMMSDEEREHLYPTKLEVAKGWLELGRKLSGDELYLYKVTIKRFQSLEERIKKVVAHARKSLQEDLDEFGIVGNGFWEDVEKEILKAIRGEAIKE